MKFYSQNIKTAFLMAVFFSISFLLVTSASAEGLETLDFEISRIIGKVADAVVTVEARSQENNTPLFPLRNNQMTDPVRTVIGSGLIIDSIGHILTVLSLVNGFDNFLVETNGEKLKASLIGIDQRLSLAVLKAEGNELPAVGISPYPPFAGRLALAYGRSQGGTGYPALGVIAGNQKDGSFLMSGSLIPGMLGGGVFDLSSRLIGLITSGGVVNDGVGGRMGGIVMLPSSVAFDAADRIINFGNKKAGYLGVRTTAIELVSGDGKVMGEGVVVSDIDDQSPAAMAGIHRGDIITHFANQEIISDKDLQRLVSKWGTDNDVILGYIRNGRDFSVSLTLKSLPDGKSMQQNNMDSSKDIMTAFTIQNKIDSLRADTRRLQSQLDLLISRLTYSR